MHIFSFSDILSSIFFIIEILKLRFYLSAILALF